MSDGTSHGPAPTARAAVETGAVSLGIELGSTRIKACLVDDATAEVLATGGFEWENGYVDGLWTYGLDEVWAGLAAAYAELAADVHERTGAALRRPGAIGVSAMMHGYLAFDDDGELLVPFRTWRNTSTGPAAEALSEAFGQNIPLRWSVAHLYQAMLDGEAHVHEAAFITTLAGYVHWRLTGERLLGVGDAAGMFPIDDATRDYDERLLAVFDGLAGRACVAGASKGTEHRDGRPPFGGVRRILPEVRLAGERAGSLTPEGARLLDPTGVLESGVPLVPPEGDAGTGMVATGAVARRTGNVSVGTSVFSMVVLDRPLSQVHHEIDLVTTPAGDPVAMVHCNNGASELAEWAGVFTRFGELFRGGATVDPDDVFATLFAAALRGDADAGGLLAYNHLSGEPIAELEEGRPLVVRAPNADFTLENFMRAQLYGVFGTLAIGMQVLAGEGVVLDRMHAHGGVFKTAGAAQQVLADALGAPVSVTVTASDGGAWGMAVLAAYLRRAEGQTLAAYLREHVFAGTAVTTREPRPEGVRGFADYLDRYRSGLAAERAAVSALPSR